MFFFFLQNLYKSLKKNLTEPKQQCSFLFCFTVFSLYTLYLNLPLHACLKVLDVVNKIKRVLPSALRHPSLPSDCIPPSFSFIFSTRAVQLVEIDIDSLPRGVYHTTVKALIIE